MRPPAEPLVSSSPMVSTCWWSPRRSRSLKWCGRTRCHCCSQTRSHSRLPSTAELEFLPEECTRAGFFSSRFCCLCTSSCAWETLSWSLVSWSFLSTLCHVQGFVGGNSKKTKHAFNGLCHQLQVYLGRGLDMCSWKVLSQMLFTKTHRERQAERVS